jgi:hypothetical protein
MWVFTRVCHAAEVPVKQFPLEAPVKLRPAPEVGIEAKVAILKLQAVHAAWECTRRERSGCYQRLARSEQHTINQKIALHHTQQ